MKLSIILPVKDEPFLLELLKQLQSSIPYPFEVKVQTEKGLGYAVKCGVEHCSGDVIVVMDSDGSHPPKAIPAMVEKLNECPIVVGSRYVKGGKTQDTFTRQLISRIYCEFAKELFGLQVKDNMSGFIAAKRYMFEKYPISNSGFKWGLEMLVKSNKEYIAKEYPIVFEQRKAGKSKADYKEAWHTLIFMLKLKANFKTSTIPH
jgi:dolichol-phosphate mannosyltransferase